MNAQSDDIRDADAEARDADSGDETGSKSEKSPASDPDAERPSGPENTGLTTIPTLGSVANYTPPPSEKDARHQFRSIMNHELPPPYFFDRKNGLIGKKVSKSRAIEICGPVLLERELRPMDGVGGSVMQLRAEDRFGDQRHVLVERAALTGDPKRVMETLARVDVDIRCSAKEMIALLQSLHTNRIGKAARQAGWVIDPATKSLFYVLADGRVVGDAGKILPAVALTGPRADPMTPRGTAATWRAQVGAFLSGNSALIFAISLGLAGPLMRWARQDALGFNFFHETSVGKTHLLSMAVGMWRNPANLDRGNATRTAIELKCLSGNDGLVVLDELPQGHPRELHQKVMMVGNGTGHGRGTRDLSLRLTHHWRTGFLTSSELPSSALFGSRADDSGSADGASVRLMDIPAGHWLFGAFNNLHGMNNAHEFTRSLKKALEENYGVIGPSFVEWLISLGYDSIEDTINRAVDEKRKELIASLPINEQNIPGPVTRCLQSFAVVAAAGTLAAEAGLLPLSAREIADAIIDVMNKWWQIRPRSIGEQIAEMQTELGRYLLANSSRLHPTSAKSAIEADAIGWIDETYAYVRVTNLRKAFFPENQTGERRIVGALRDRGIIVAGGEAGSSQYRMPPTLSPSRERVYRVQFDRLGLPQDDEFVLKMREVSAACYS